jgi:transposase
MWTSENRCQYERQGLRYPSDLTDAEWALVEPHIRPAKRGGRPRTTDMREVTNALLYLLGTGCQWRALPKDFPPRTTVFEYLDLWEWDGTLARLHHALFVATREQAGKEASPTAAIIDSQSVKGAEKDAMGRAARVRHHRRCQATDGEPHASSGRPEPFPHRL